MRSQYKIVDEPEVSPSARYAVSPHWPLLAAMLGGSWLALPWFAFNAHAIGSATKRKELTWAAASPLVSLVIALVAFPLVEALGFDTTTRAGFGEVLGLPSRTYAYIGAVIISVKLYFAYRINFYQSKSHDIHTTIHGPGFSGLPLVVGALLLRPFVLGAAGDLSIYALILVL
jgi:hypothetical protein